MLQKFLEGFASGNKTIRAGSHMLQRVLDVLIPLSVGWVTGEMFKCQEDKKALGPAFPLFLLPPDRDAPFVV